MKLDQEIDVLGRCYDLLSKLDDDVKVRVLQWLSSKFQLGQTTLTIASAATMANGESTESEEVAPAAPKAVEKSKPAAVDAGPASLDSYNSFMDLYRVLKPTSDAEKALVSAVFLGSKRNQNEISSAQVQKELKSIGERVSNITQAISALVKKKLMHQIGKEGNSQQARKKYKVTPEAVRMVGEMLKKRV